jgi:small subunit ribosomal protein S14
MSKKSVKVRQEKRLILSIKYKKKRKEFKKNKKHEKLDKIPKNASPVRLKNRCKITGRNRGYIRKFGVSRIIFRE